VLLAAGPVVGIGLLMVPVTFGDATCGSALSASLERGIPNDAALDRYQAGCKATGQRIVDVALVLGGGAIVVAAVCAAGAALPDPRRLPLPA
jgi:hypothetical protein